MFGQNRVRKQERQPDQLQVQDIWYTIQGEGPFAGRPAVFARLTGCNLRCWFCDTQWDDDNDKVHPVGDVAATIIAECLEHKCDLVVLTGGEPMRQDLSKLLPILLEARLRVQIETAGTLWQPCVGKPGVTIVVSPKTGKLHPEIYHRAHAFKYVIRAGAVSERDGLPIQGTQDKLAHCELARPRPGVEVYLSPCDEYDVETNKRNRDAVGFLAMQHGYIAGLQLHKVFELP